MTEFLHRLLPAPVGAVITVTSAGASWLIAAIAPWQEHVDWAMRVSASCLAVCVGLYTLREPIKGHLSTIGRWFIKSRKKGK